MVGVEGGIIREDFNRSPGVTEAIPAGIRVSAVPAPGWASEAGRADLDGPRQVIGAGERGGGLRREEMKAVIYRPARYRHQIPKVCPYCRLNESIGFTRWGVLGCEVCQGKVDRGIEARFTVIRVVKL